MRIEKRLDGRYVRVLSPIEQDLYVRLMGEIQARKRHDLELQAQLDAHEQTIIKLQTQVNDLTLQVAQGKKAGG